MSVEIKANQVSLTDFFQLKSKSAPADLVDMTYDPSEFINDVKSFLNSKGDAVYRVNYFVANQKVFDLKIDSIKFEFFTSYPSSNSIPLPGCTFVELVDPPKFSDTSIDPFRSNGNFKVPVDNIYSVYVSADAAGFEGYGSVSGKLLIPQVSQGNTVGNFLSKAKESEKNLELDPAQTLNAGLYTVAPPSPVGFTNSFIKDHVTEETRPKNYASVIRTQTPRVSLKDKMTERKNIEKGGPDSSLMTSFANENLLPVSANQTSNLVKLTVLSENIEYMRDFYIEKNILSGYEKIYMRVTGNFSDESDSISGSEVYEINHQSEVLDFIGTPSPPNFTVIQNTISNISVSLTKTDPMLDKALVVRIVKNPYSRENFIEKRGTVDFANGSSVIFTDTSPNTFPNTVIYRFIAQNHDGSYGSFNSFIPKVFKSSNYPDLSYTASTPISIRASNEPNSVSISMHILTEEVTTVRLMREDTLARGDYKDRLTNVPTVLNELLVNVNNKKAIINFTDKNVINGRIYRYFALYRLAEKSASSEEISSDEDEYFIKRPVSSQQIFDAAVVFKNIQASTNNSITVNFDLQIKEINEAYDFFLKALQSARVDVQFVQELANDKQKLKQIAGFLVERVDRVSGIRETFGLYPPGAFSDSPQERNKVGISEPIPGGIYEYIFKLCIRPAPSFLKSSYTNILSQIDQPGNFTSKLASKYLNDAFVSQGILPSETALREDTSISDNMKLGQTGIEIVSSVISVPDVGPTINVLEPIVKGGYALISWEVLGNVKSISYFLVYCLYNNQKNLLGTVSCVGEGSTYKFRDDKYGTAVGKKSYSIELVKINNDKSITSPEIVLIKDFSVPLDTIGGYIIPSKETKVFTDVKSENPGSSATSENNAFGKNIDPGNAFKKISEKYGLEGLINGISKIPNIASVSSTAASLGSNIIPNVKSSQPVASNPLPPKPTYSDPVPFLGIANIDLQIKNDTISKTIDLVKNSKSQNAGSTVDAEKAGISKIP